MRILSACLLFWTALLLRAADPAPGVSLELARGRHATLREPRYELSFRIPALPTERITGRAVLKVDLIRPGKPLVLDFAPGAEGVKALTVAGRPVAWRAVNGHLVVPASALKRGLNQVEIDFVAGDGSLNRQPDFLYTLFVPARAREAFPCFDQPDLKARFALTLEVPAGWQAVANGAEASRSERDGRLVVSFAETQPLPTYLFSFAAGTFQVETAERGGRTMRLFHRETDAAKLARNREALFDLHASALSWLEAYTGLSYPFGKFDFVVVPSFQYGGMEHPGAILYGASALMLEESATLAQTLDRASLIAHETAHMWFGDLVTMPWFDDVWMKEVFAGLMASKIVHPSFPGMNHDLRFLFETYPGAYSVDRTPGTHPIRQPLANLAEAGSLYGPIIYDKAPIAMRNLEQLVGEATFREGIRTYLKRHAHGNAAWPDLLKALRAHTRVDVAAWSRAWVEREGRPTVHTKLDLREGRIARLAFLAEDPAGRGRRWDQRLSVTLGGAAGLSHHELLLAKPQTTLEAARGLAQPHFLLPNGQGLGYGLFRLDPSSRTWLLAHLPEIPDALTRGAAWIALREEMLEGALPPRAFLELILAALPRESEEQTVEALLGWLNQLYWRQLDLAARAEAAPRVEAALREGLARAQGESLKGAYFRAFRDTAQGPEALAWLERLWRKEEKVPGLVLGEPDFNRLALELALREVPGWKALLEAQQARIQGPDEKARFTFVLPAVDADPAVRQAFFERLKTREHRRREAWVIEGLNLLHHPLRARASEGFIRPALELLEEIRRTGDIFFPQRWVGATLGGHASPQAAATVRAFLAGLPPAYPPRLRATVHVAADALFRAAAMRQPAPSHHMAAAPPSQGPATGPSAATSGPRGF